VVGGALRAPSTAMTPVQEVASEGAPGDGVDHPLPGE
jgi:hypothetical protein